MTDEPLPYGQFSINNIHRYDSDEDEPSNPEKNANYNTMNSQVNNNRVASVRGDASHPRSDSQRPIAPGQQDQSSSIQLQSFGTGQVSSDTSGLGQHVGPVQTARRAVPIFNQFKGYDTR